MNKQSIKSILFSTGIVMLGLSACKNDKKDLKIVGKNSAGEELTVNEKGDTIKLKETVKDIPEEGEVVESTEEKKEAEVKAFTKNPDESYVFRFNLEKGKSYPFKVATNIKNVQSDGKESQQVQQSSENELSYKVREVKSDKYILDVNFKRFKEKISVQGKTMGFDTNVARPSNEMNANKYDFFKTVVGNSFTMEISKGGKVLNVTGLDEIRNKVKTKMEKGLNQEDKKVLEQMLQVSVSKEAMAAMFMESIGYYPQKPVKMGDKWEMNNNVGKAKAHMEYKLSAIDDNQASIKISGNSSANDSQTSKEGMKVSQNLKGSVNGTAKIDVKSGWVNSVTIEKKEVLKMTREYKGEKMTLTATTTSSTKVN